MLRDKEKIIEFESYEKNKKKIHLIDIIKALFLVAVFSVIGFWAYNNQDKLTVENARVLLSYFDFNNHDPNGNTTDKLNFMSGAYNRFGMYDGCFCILTNDGLTVFKPDGTQNFIQISFKNPVLQTGRKFMLLYGIGENSVNIVNQDSIVKTLFFDNEITGASINDSGYFSVVSGESGYLSQITVYNRDMEKIFKWYSSEEYITSSSISPGNKSVCVASLNAGNGVNSEITFFSFDREEPLSVTNYDDDIVMDLKYKDANLAAAVTTKRLIFFNGSGEAKGEYIYSNGYIWKYDLGPKYYSVLAFCKNSAGIGIDLKIVDNAGKVTGEHYFDGTVDKIAADNDRVVVLGRGKIWVLDSSGNLKNEIDISYNIKDIVLDGSYVYLISTGSADRIKLD